LIEQNKLPRNSSFLSLSQSLNSKTVIEEDDAIQSVEKILSDLQLNEKLAKDQNPTQQAWGN
jgi:hypothetical protein